MQLTLSLSSPLFGCNAFATRCWARYFSSYQLRKNLFGGVRDVPSDHIGEGGPRGKCSNKKHGFFFIDVFLYNVTKKEKVKKIRKNKSARQEKRKCT